MNSSVSGEDRDCSEEECSGVPQRVDKRGSSMNAAVNSGSMNGSGGSPSGNKQKKRGIFPKMATNAMRAWLFQHLNVCYNAYE